jgi:two-component system chemotaxis sensor kinase CheA
MDPLLLLRELGEVAEIVELHTDDSELPGLADLESDRSYLRWRATLRSTRSLAQLEEIFAFTDGCEIRNAASTTAMSRTMAPAEPVAAESEPASIRVTIDKVDRLMNLVGEMVIAQSTVSQTVADFTPKRLFDLQESVAQLERLMRDLQERVLAIRMVPVGNVLGRFPRMVRDLAMTLDKQVTLKLVGADTEVDKSVIERITDPLTHLIRNAVDHGIESAERRRAAGKPECGTVTVTAHHQAGNILIDVADDGGGLDGDRLLERAVRLGLVGADEALSEQEKLELIYRPGFSTASTVSDISGRGVGMDVVLRNIQSINGAVRIQSELGRGTCFRIVVPLTLAIVDGLCLGVGDESYVLPLVAIVESLQVAPEHVKTVAGRGETVMVRGEALPLVRLHRLFGVQPRVTEVARALVVIIENEGRRVALLVDGIQGQVQAVIKSLETNYRRVDGVMGATILSDGRVGLILDVLGLVRMAQQTRRAPVRVHA